MFYYLVAPLNQKVHLLTYTSDEVCAEFDIVKISLRQKECLAIIIQPCDEPNFHCKKLQKTQLFFTTFQKQLGKFIAQYYCCGYSEAFGIFTPMKNEEKFSQPSYHCCLKPLNHLQNKALNFVLNRNLSLIFGDTGSGKTEIYFHLIDRFLKKEKVTILLMPEISLTPQMEKRLKEVFGDLVAIWHSKVGAKRKEEILKRIANKEVKIVAGARSALFLPIQDLGLVIVDEEHDDAYKSQSKPKYHARDLSIFLSDKTSVKVVLGSATPSVQSYFIAKSKNALFRLKGGFFKTQKDFIFDSSLDIPSSMLIHSLKEMKQKEKQGIIFLPTRANFKTLICGCCGESIVCKNCSITLSLHQKRNLMLCHYCGFSRDIPQICPSCGASDFISKRIGTAQIALELEKNLPDLRIGVFDRDHISTEKKLKEILERFKNKELDILVGTQMLSKGHDYHNVWLSVILEIDYLFRAPDFRCNERAFELLYQVAGRTGRRDDGVVLIQTINQGLIQNFLNDYEDFLQYELNCRQDLYPPFKKLIVLHFRNKDEQIAYQKMLLVLDRLKKCDAFEIVGAEKSGINRIGGIYRYHILLRIHFFSQALRKIKQIFDELGGFEVDVDPIDLL